MAKKPLIQILHDQTIVKIDTSDVHGFEQEGSGFCYRVTATGEYTLNGVSHSIHDEDNNSGTQESLEPIRDNIMKLLRPYKVLKANLPLDLDDVDDVDELETSREKLEAYIGYHINFGQVAELVVEDGKFKFVSISLSDDNFKCEEEMFGEEEDEDDEDDEDYEDDEDEDGDDAESK